MRLFIGSTLSPPLVGLIGQTQVRLSGLPVRLIGAENLHLTLVPPWQAASPEEAIVRLDELCADLRPGGCFFERFVVERLLRREGMIWLRGVPDAALIALKARLMEVFAPGHDPFSFLPHITIARYAKNQAHAIPPIDMPAGFQEHCGNLTLFRSHLGASGAHYEILHRIILS